MTGELEPALRAAFRAAGAEVRLFDDADNCVRRREPGEGCAALDDEPARLPFVVEAQGVPNLLHELAHVVLLGRVEKDHATDYSRIPFDLTSPHGRTLLFEELACCAASCAWHPGDDDAAQAWFEEQVGIQDLFFGAERDLARFLAAADAQLRAHGDELERVLARARLGIERALAAAGAPADIARSRREISVASFATMWERLRARAPQ